MIDIHSALVSLGISADEIRKANTNAIIISQSTSHLPFLHHIFSYSKLNFWPKANSSARFIDTETSISSSSSSSSSFPSSSTTGTKTNMDSTSATVSSSSSDPKACKNNDCVKCQGIESNPSTPPPPSCPSLSPSSPSNSLSLSSPSSPPSTLPYSSISSSSIPSSSLLPSAPPHCFSAVSPPPPPPRVNAHLSRPSIDRRPQTDVPTSLSSPTSVASPASRCCSSSSAASFSSSSPSSSSSSSFPTSSVDSSSTVASRRPIRRYIQPSLPPPLQFVQAHDSNNQHTFPKDLSNALTSPTLSYALQQDLVLHCLQMKREDAIDFLLDVGYLHPKSVIVMGAKCFSMNTDCSLRFLKLLAKLMRDFVITQPIPPMLANGESIDNNDQEMERREIGQMETTVSDGEETPSIVEDVAMSRREVPSPLAIQLLTTGGIVPFLRTACTRGGAEKVDFFLKLLRIQLSPNVLGSLISMAASHGHADVLRVLLALKNVTREAVQNDNNAALRSGCQRGSLDIVKLLLGQGLTLLDVRSERNFALKIASKLGHLDIIKVLVDMGIGVDDVRENHCQVLRSAQRYKRNTVVEYLFKLGLDERDKLCLNFEIAEPGRERVDDCSLERSDEECGDGEEEGEEGEGGGGEEGEGEEGEGSEDLFNGYLA